MVVIFVGNIDAIVFGVFCFKDIGTVTIFIVFHFFFLITFFFNKNIILACCGILKIRQGAFCILP